MTAVAAELGRRLSSPVRERVHTTLNGAVVDVVTTYHPRLFSPNLKERRHYEIATFTPGGEKEVYRRLPASGVLKVASWLLLPSAISQADAYAMFSNLARKRLAAQTRRKAT